MSGNAHKRYKKINNKIPGNHAVSIMRDEKEKKNALKCDEDTIIRTEIHGIIISKIKEGIQKEDIIKYLSKKPRYEKYTKYFETWVTDKMIKVSKKEKYR